jgi:hypothetical protein
VGPDIGSIYGLLSCVAGMRDTRLAGDSLKFLGTIGIVGF